MRCPKCGYIFPRINLQKVRGDYKIFWGRIHGKSYHELSLETNLKQNAMAARVRANFPYLKHHRPRLSLYENQPLRKISNDCLDGFIQEGFSQTDIANSCNCSRQLISDRLKRRGIDYSLVITNKDLKMWRRYAKAYWLRIQGTRIVDIEKQTKVMIGNDFYKYFPELKTKGPGYKRYLNSYMPWFQPTVLAWHTKAYWYKVQGLTIKEICNRVKKSRQLINALTTANPEIALKIGSWKKSRRISNER